MKTGKSQNGGKLEAEEEEKLENEEAEEAEEEKAENSKTENKDLDKEIEAIRTNCLKIDGEIDKVKSKDIYFIIVPLILVLLRAFWYALKSGHGDILRNNS